MPRTRGRTQRRHRTRRSKRDKVSRIQKRAKRTRRVRRRKRAAPTRGGARRPWPCKLGSSATGHCAACGSNSADQKVYCTRACATRSGWCCGYHRGDRQEE